MNKPRYALAQELGNTLPYKEEKNGVLLFPSDIAVKDDAYFKLLQLAPTPQGFTPALLQKFTVIQVENTLAKDGDLQWRIIN